MGSSRLSSFVFVLPAVLLSAATCKNAPPAEPNPAKAAPTPAPAPKPGADRQASLVLSGVPGMDFSVLPAPAQKELATVFTDEFCYCGCPHTLGGCLKQHAACKHAPRMALLAASEASAGTPAVEIILGLSKYYASFGAARQTFQPDERMCKGPKDAKLTLVEFSDFECPYCAAARPMLEALVKKRPELRVCYLPFTLSGHPNSLPAAQAAMLARDKGKFWQMHDALFENQQTLSPATIVELGEKLGLPRAELEKALESGRYAEELKAFKEVGRAAGVTSTPSLFLNGRKFGLGLTSETLAHTVDDELEWIAQGGGWAAD